MGPKGRWDRNAGEKKRAGHKLQETQNLLPKLQDRIKPLSNPNQPSKMAAIVKQPTADLFERKVPEITNLRSVLKQPSDGKAFEE